MVAKNLILKLAAFASIVLLLLLSAEGSTAGVKLFGGSIMVSTGAIAVLWASFGYKFLPPARKTVRRIVTVFVASLIALGCWWAYALHLNSIEMSGAWGCDPGVGVSPQCTGLYGPPGIKYYLIYGSFFLILALIITSLSYIIFHLTKSWMRKSRNL